MRHDSHGHGQDDDLKASIDKGYDTRDVSVVSVLKALFFLFVFVGASSVIALVIYNIMVPRGEMRTSAFPIPRVQAVPPDPRLQANPMLDIKTFREQEATALTKYGRDSKTGEIHIPIDRAIDIVSQEGLPTRPNPGEPNPQEPNVPTVTEGSVPTGGQESPLQTGAGTTSANPADAAQTSGTNSTPGGATGGGNPSAGGTGAGPGDGGNRR